MFINTASLFTFFLIMKTTKYNKSLLEMEQVGQHYCDSSFVHAFRIMLLYTLYTVSSMEKYNKENALEITRSIIKVNYRTL